MRKLRLPSDPLLNIAGIIVWGLYGLLLVAIVMVSVGLFTTLTVGRDEQMAELAAAGLGMTGYLMVLTSLLLIDGLLILALMFARNLLRIMESVGEGDPFVPANADLLLVMGWLAAGGEAILVALIGIALWFGGAKQIIVAEEATGMFISGFILMLITFILARVFRLGTRLRDDLEGTV